MTATSGGRKFYEEDDTPDNDPFFVDKCWFDQNVVPKYSKLNGGFPIPSEQSPAPLDQDESWDDHVGWGNVAVLYYRQNPSALAHIC